MVPTQHDIIKNLGIDEINAGGFNGEWLIEAKGEVLESISPIDGKVIAKIRQVSDEDYENVKRRYMTVSIKAWLLSLSVKEKCRETVTPVLYFYSGDCETCIEQGFILDTIRNDTKAMVYTVDINLDLDAIKIIRDAYKIDTVPSLLINDEVYTGLIKYEKVWELVTEGGSDLYF